MSKLSDRVSYLQGLAEGMKLNPEKDSNRVLLEMLNVLGEAADEIDDLRAQLEEQAEYIDSMDDDLADLEDAFFGDDYDEDDMEEWDDEDDDSEKEDGDEDEGEWDDFDPNEVIVYNCPHCGHEMEFKASEIDFNEDYTCPACGKPFFPEIVEEAGDTSAIDGESKGE
jgi:DNA-directed RNA polymerase subunit RPC12/RpoP